MVGVCPGGESRLVVTLPPLSTETLRSGSGSASSPWEPKSKSRSLMASAVGLEKKKNFLSSILVQYVMPLYTPPLPYPPCHRG